MHMKSIVVGYDGEEPAKRALERSAELAEAFDAKLVVTSVAPIMVGSGRGSGAVDPTDTPDDHERELQEARSYLSGRKVAAEYQPAIGDPGDTIVEVAEHVGADLIVVGSGERNLLERLLGRSVSDTVAHHARCDVLIVH
jgi:nucleotide-binding universal stress UspA family protein